MNKSIFKSIFRKLFWIALFVGLFVYFISVSISDSGDYKKFYMHKTGHWLGLDVHDVGEYKIAGDFRELEAGMVFTIEPGLYIPP